MDAAMQREHVQMPSCPGARRPFGSFSGPSCVLVFVVGRPAQAVAHGLTHGHHLGRRMKEHKGSVHMYIALVDNTAEAIAGPCVCLSHGLTP
eukprot:scaffold11716_cov112-Isochrysis_galbana.AAC.6